MPDSHPPLYHQPPLVTFNIWGWTTWHIDTLAEGDSDQMVDEKASEVAKDEAKEEAKEAANEEANDVANKEAK